MWMQKKYFAKLLLTFAGPLKYHIEIIPRFRLVIIQISWKYSTFENWNILNIYKHEFYQWKNG